MTIFPLVTIIIPIHNAEPHLRNCLRSIQQQTLVDIEIICINDGSTDGSSEIIQEAARSDQRIILIDQAQQGPGGARNSGLKTAMGRYIMFVDADDFVSPTYVSSAPHSGVAAW